METTNKKNHVDSYDSSNDSHYRFAAIKKQISN